MYFGNNILIFSSNVVSQATCIEDRQPLNESYSYIYIVLSHSCEVLLESEGSFVAFCLDGIGLAELKGRVADEAGAATQGEWNGNCLDELIIGIIDRDGFVFHDTKSDEQGCGLLSAFVSRHRRSTYHLLN